MKQVNFKVLKVKNLLSIGDEWITLNYNPGLHTVTGFNYDKRSYNGVGKTGLMADALAFVLFGSLVRDTTKDYVGNRFTGKGAKAVLTFDVISGGVKSEYTLTRSLNPSKVQLMRGEENITKSSIPKTNEYISKLINTSSEIFTNTIVMTLNDTVPFMAQKKIDKRKFIEGILRLEVFSNMLLLVRQNFNDLKRECDTELARLDELKNSLKVYIQQQRTFLENKENKILELNLREKANKREIETLTSKLSEKKWDVDGIQNNIKLLKEKEIKCDEEINGFNKQIGEYCQKIKNIGAQVAELVTREDFCVKCKRPFTEKDKEETQHEIDELENKKKVLAQKVVEANDALLKQIATKDLCKKGINVFQQQLTDKELADKENEAIVARIEQLHSWNKQLTNDIKKHETEQTDFGSLIKETQEREKLLNEQCAEIQKKLENLKVIKFIVSEEGVKSFIVKKVLKILNGKLRYYLKKFESNCVLSFNEYFEEHLVDEFGHETTYNNFSGGEKKRIDLASLFAFMDIRRLQGDVSTNISIYDELFDSALEEKGVALILDVLKERVETYKEAVYLITHKKIDKLLSDGPVETIFLEKRQGRTKRVLEGGIDAATV